MIVWCYFLLLFASFAEPFPRHLLYPHGQGYDQFLPKQNDVSSPEVVLQVPIVFYGDEYRSIYVNSNGLLSFQTEIPAFFNIQFPLNYPIIAPLYTNVDIRHSGTVSYRETQDLSVLIRATRNVRDNFSSTKEFEAKSVFLATWLDVGYFNGGHDKLNTFQVAIISDGEDSYVEFIYPDKGIQWIQGTGSESGLPDARAQAGLVSAEGIMFNLRGSGTDRVHNLEKRSNMGSPGQWIFRVGKIETVEEPDLNDDIDSSQQEYMTCTEGSTQCHSKAHCVDHADGFCCNCGEYYYGNGKMCVKSDVPIRVNGKVTGTVNGVAFTNQDLQSYVVMADGRAYTAISKIPRQIGFSSQVLYNVGGLIGFLFAKPIGDTKNGYQITGGNFTQRADIQFDDGSKVEIRHHYHGLDVFDQLRMEATIEGTVPELPDETKLILTDYEEQITIRDHGWLTSEGTITYRVGELEHEHRMSIKQNLNYEACKYAKLPEEPTWKLKVSKNFISYEAREQIIRFGMTNKVVPLGEIDPCKEGQLQCGIDSTCVVEGDGFRCVCKPGFHYIYSDNDHAVCVDINECQVGLHNCDINGQCINEPGRFSCRCNPGYEGDGYHCRKIKTCSEIRCPQNAQCSEAEAKCRCLPGFIGDGRVCVADKHQSCDVVNNCSPYAMCALSEETDQYECQCLSGYSGNGWICEPSYASAEHTTESSTPISNEELVVEQCLLGVCWCPEGMTSDGNRHCIKKVEQPPVTSIAPPEEPVVQEALPVCLDTNRYTCSCPWGFDYDIFSHSCNVSPGVVMDTKGPSGSHNTTCNIINNCHPEAQCVFVSHYGGYQCQCNAGFEGDGYDCVETDVTCTDDLCDSHASCVYDESMRKARCMCNPGFEGNGLFCEAIPHCTSHADCDENEDCVYTAISQRYECVCKEGYFKETDDDYCHLMRDTCNGATCAENAQCLYDPELQTHYCQCHPEYTGDGVQECRPRPIGCHELNNCGVHASCVYEDALGMYQCSCDDGYFGDGFICTKQKTCHVDPYMCDVHAKCVLNVDRVHVCECDPGYTGNGSFCRVTPKHDGNFLLLNQGMATLRVPFDASPTNPGRPIQIQYSQMAIGIDIDCFEGRVYWSDIGGKALKSSTYNGTNYTIFIGDNIGSPEGISIDWVSRNIFWTDSGKDTLEVANLDTKLRKILFSDGLENPRGIAVHPQRGKIFWSDWDRRNPKIEWANMDGTGRDIFLRGARVQLPNSLAVDWETDNLCFADAGTKKIECVDIDSRSVRTMAQNCSYPFGLAITESHFYWSDWVSKKIESVSRRSLEKEKPISVPLTGSDKQYGLVAVPDRCPGISNVCQFYNGQCSPGHLCLPNGVGSRTCVCAKDLCNDVK